MEHIIAGRFSTKVRADDAVAVLVHYVGRGDICVFHNNPPGQHGSHMTETVNDVNPDAGEAEETAAATALAAGAAAGLIGMAGGPVTALAAAGVAAYTGSLLGTFGGSGEDPSSPSSPHLRPAGVILAVRINRQTSSERVVSDLRNCGAEDIERAEGDWRDGDWVDFNPLQKPHLVAA